MEPTSQPTDKAARTIHGRTATRLYVEAPLVAGASIALDAERAHYLRHVLRLEAGAAVALFNGRDGQWRAELEAGRKRVAIVKVHTQMRAQTATPDLWLVFAPIKRARIDFLAAKATELGVSALQAVFTRHTAVERVNVERLRANAIEAAEQTERLSVPDVGQPRTLEALLGDWPTGRRLMVCDEAGFGAPIAQALAALDAAARAAPWAILIGPEGGFAAEELARLRGLDFALPVSLGPRILRADTAALAALACWQALLGDWRLTPKRLDGDYAARGSGS